MSVNQIPRLSADNPTGCCPRFDPQPWDDQTITFANKPFVSVSTRSFMYMPLNMGKVMTKTLKHIEAAHAEDKGTFLLLSQDVSPWKAKHLFWVSKPVPGMDMACVNGVYKTKVFEGPYSKIKEWYKEMIKVAKENGTDPLNIYFYYTTCPKCQKVYKKNYVVGFVQIA